MKKTDTKDNEKRPQSELDSLKYLVDTIFRQNSDELFLQDVENTENRKKVDNARELVHKYTGIQVPKNSSIISEIEDLLICLSKFIVNDSLHSMVVNTNASGKLYMATRKLIVAGIIHFSSFNSKIPLQNSPLIFHDARDGFYIKDPETDTLSAKSHTLNIPFIWPLFQSITKQNNVFFLCYLQNYFPDQVKILDTVSEEKKNRIYNTIWDFLSKDERSIRRWIDNLLDYIIKDKPKGKGQSVYEQGYIDEKIPEPTVDNDINISNLDEEILGFYINPVPVEPRIKIVEKLNYSIDDKVRNLDYLFNFQSLGILCGPPYSGKTTTLLEIAQSSDKCVYISCSELCKLNYPDISQYIKSNIQKQIRKQSGKENLLRYISAVDYSDVLILLDDVNCLPNEKIDWLLFQIDSYNRVILATNNVLPIKEQSDRYSKIEIMPFSEKVVCKFISTGLSIDGSELLTKYSGLDFCAYVGGMVFLFENFHKPFEQIIINLFKSLLKTESCKEESVELDHLFKYITKKINERISMQQFQGLREYSVDEKKVLINEIDMAISNSSIPLLENEENKRELLKPFFSNFLRIENNKIVFQYKEIAWIFFVAALESRDLIGSYYTSQLGYMTFQTNIWGFFLNYFESCVNDNRRIGMIDLIKSK